MIDLSLKPIYRVSFGIIFILLLVTEIIETFKYGAINALDYDVLIFSILSLIAILVNNRLTKLIISIVLGYFIWALLTQHFPSYPEYQAFTSLFNLIGLKPLKIQLLAHVFLYFGLMIGSFISKNKEVKYT